MSMLLQQAFQQEMPLRHWNCITLLPSHISGTTGLSNGKSAALYVSFILKPRLKTSPNRAESILKHIGSIQRAALSPAPLPQVGEGSGKNPLSRGRERVAVRPGEGVRFLQLNVTNHKNFIRPGFHVRRNDKSESVLYFQKKKKLGTLRRPVLSPTANQQLSAQPV
jgi:hypothetical protein